VFGDDSTIRISATQFEFDNSAPFDTVIQLRFTRFPKIHNLPNNGLFNTATEIFNVDFASPYSYLPAGFSYQFSGTGFYDVASGDTTACVRICADNVPPGDYNLNIYSFTLASGMHNTGGGFYGGQIVFDTFTNHFSLPINVHVTGHYNEPYLSFSVQGSNIRRPLRICAPQDLLVNPLIPHNCFTEYRWGFDGGSFSNINGPWQIGTHFVSLETDVYKAELKSALIHATGSAVWDTGSAPDLYLRLGNRSTLADHTIDQAAAQFPNLNWPLSNSECSWLYIDVMDYDGDDSTQNTDDVIDNYILNSADFVGGNAQTVYGANSFLFVQVEKTFQYTERDTFWFQTDTFPTPVIVASPNAFCKGDTAVLRALPFDSSYTYTWGCSFCTPQWQYTGHGPTYTTTFSDSYSVTVTDSECSASSQSIFNFYTFPDTSLSIVQSGDSLVVSPVPQMWFHIDWYLSGNLYAVNANTIKPTVSGEYTAVVYNRDNSLCQSNISYDYTAVSNVNNLTRESAISISPNPAGNYFELRSVEDLEGMQLNVTNTLGQKLITMPLSGTVSSIGTSTLPSGVYLVELTKGTVKSTLRLVISK
jgi:hypothetical protein